MKVKNRLRILNNMAKQYYELEYHKTMNADEAKKLLEGCGGLTLEMREFQWGWDKFGDSSIISFIGSNGTNYKGRAGRRCEEGKSLNKGDNKVWLAFLLYNPQLIGPLEEKVVGELGFTKKEGSSN